MPVDFTRKLGSNKIKRMTVNGFDGFSYMSMHDLSELVGKDVFEEVVEKCERDRTVACDAARWFLRGLCWGDACKKAITNKIAFGSRPQGRRSIRSARAPQGPDPEVDDYAGIDD